ncbi:YbaY family lipoprotein [Brevundimonas sp. VNH65]|uniref:YbaY family lipoprotein n=1 Tax=Brevundimonas sp. VNH65 TaxID=3400917 RepID=UPI003C121054
MGIRLTTGVAALLACALTGCAATTGAPSAPPQVGHGMITVQVSVSYRERILLPPGHVLTVRIEDVSLADAPSRILAEHRETLDGRGPPYVTTLGVPASAIDPRHSYAARAEIRDPAGGLRFVTDTRHSVLTQGAGSTAEIVLRAAGN